MIANYSRTFLLMAAMTALFLGVGYLLGGTNGMVTALIFALVTNFFSYWYSDKLVLRMYGARQITETDHPQFYRMIANLAQRAAIPMPKVFIMESPQPNAFATGRNPENASVAATTGLLEILDMDEVEGVMAHELAHVKNRDTLIMTITATIAGAISMLINFMMFFGHGRDRENGGTGILGSIALMILAPMAAMLVQMAISRAREYEADRVGAEICGNPAALARALEKIESAARQVYNAHAESNPATAHLFIINPLHGRAMDNLFSTHPNTGNRIRKLMEMGGSVVERTVSAVTKATPWQRAASRRPWG